jgi:septal ring factor EnvC (AmiA/AmiB activator)
MGEKAELRRQLTAVRAGHTETMRKLGRAEDEVRRLRSDVGTLTDRLEDTHRRLQDQRAFIAAVAELDRLSLRLLLTTDPQPEEES